MRQTHPFGFVDDEIDALAVAIWEAYETDIPRYAYFAESSLRDDVVAASRNAIEVYLRVMDTGVLPDRNAAQEIIKVERRRLSQGFRPEELQRAAILQYDLLWHAISDRVTPERLPALASLTLRLVDVLAGSRSQAQHQLTMTQMANVRSYVSELLLNEIETPEHDSAVSEEAAKSIGYNLTAPNVGIVLGSDHRSPFRTTTAQVRSFHRALDRVRKSGIEVLGAVADDGYRMVVSARRRSIIGPTIDLLIEQTEGLDSMARAGVGTGLPGLSGIRRSLRQAARARTISALLDPDARTAFYDDIAPLDIFVDDEVGLRSFARRTLAPLIAADEESGGNLLETVQVMFDCGWSRKLTASRLHLHPNSIDYRIKQAERLLGTSFDQGRSMFKILLALQLMPPPDKT